MYLIYTIIYSIMNIILLQINYILFHIMLNTLNLQNNESRYCTELQM